MPRPISNSPAPRDVSDLNAHLKAMKIPVAVLRSWHGGKLVVIVHHGHPKVIAGTDFGEAVPIAVTHLSH